MADGIDIGASLRPLGAPPPDRQTEATTDSADVGASLRQLGSPALMGTSWLKMGQDAYRGLGLGTRAVAEGLGGVVGGAGDILTAPGRLAMRAVGYQPPKELPWMQDLTTPPSTQIQGAIDTTGLPTPKTPAEQNISTFERGATAAALAGPRAGLAGGGGALTGDLAANSDYVPEWAKPTVRAVGTLAGAAGTTGLTKALDLLAYPAKALTGRLPGMVSEDVAPLADKFINEYGIKLDPTQLTANPTSRIAVDQLGKLPLSGAGARIAEARGQWQSAVAGEMGENAPSGITHAVMGRAADRIGAAFDRVTNNATIQGGKPLQDDLVAIAQDMPRYGVTDAQKIPLQAQFQNVLKAFADGNGTITGKAYQNLTQRGGPLDTVISSNDPTIHGFAMRIKDALDDALGRSVSPEDRAALSQARYQFRVMKTIQPLVEQKGLTGDIDPNALLQRVRAQSTKYDSSTGGLAYTGGGKLGDLAYGGQIFFGRAADSGTAARGGAIWAATHPVQAALLSPALLVNRGAQSVLRSPAIGERMVENTVRPQPPPPTPLFGVTPATGLSLLGLQ